MSGHFVYEIDERKLRVRLQEFEVEPKQEAWSNFEAYYHSVQQQKNDRQGLKFNVPISMNVLLPIVFGAVIIIIAVLLFQFISIKNPPVNEIEKVIEPAKQIKDTSAIKPVKPLVLTHLDSIAKGLVSVPTKSTEPLPKDTLIAAPPAQTVSASNNSSKQVVTNKVALSDTGRKNKELSKSKTEIKNDKENTKPKKKKSKKSSNETSEQEKLIEELPGNTVDETGASLKPNTP